LDIQGCWGDFSEGGGLIFEFDQNESGTKLKRSSRYELRGKPGVGASAKLTGSVGSTRFKFAGRGGYSTGLFIPPPRPHPTNCSIKGSGTGDASQLTIEYEFQGSCARFFGHGPFPVSLTPCP
jgi:hypothetical protein